MEESSEFIVTSALPPITGCEGLTISEFVWSNLHLKANRIAFECSTTGRKLTCGEVFQQSRGFAAGLLDAGLKNGQVVCVVLPNVIEYPAIFYGILEAGGIISPINPAYTGDEIVAQFTSCEAVFAVTVSSLVTTMKEVAKHTPTLKSIIVVGESHEGCQSFSEMVKMSTTGVSFLKGAKMDTGSTVAVLPYSSGTTGIPKGVQLTHRNIICNVMQYIAPGCSFTNNVDLGQEPHRLIGVLPFFHSYGQVSSVLAGLYAGNHTLCMQKFGADTFVKSLRQFKPHVLTLVPPLIGFLVQNAEVTAKDFENVVCIQTGAAPLGAALINKLIEKADKNIFIQSIYGLTEMSPVVSVLNPKFGNTKIESCGNVLPSTSAKIIHIDTGEILGPHLTGELCLFGPQVMMGYYKNEIATNDMLDSDGWLHTGDIAYYDEEKCFFVIDRIKELIKVNGLQVAPAELEDCIRQHSEVADVAVIGIPDEKFGELPRAYIVRRSASLLESQIHQLMEAKLSKHKQLAGGIEFIDVIPKSVSGKILRRKLKEKFSQKIVN